MQTNTYNLTLTLRVFCVINIVFLIISCAGSMSAEHKIYQTPLSKTVIFNVSILSVDGTSMIPNQTVVIDGGKIISISDATSQLSSTKQIDGTDAYSCEREHPVALIVNT